MRVWRWIHDRSIDAPELQMMTIPEAEKRLRELLVRKALVDAQIENIARRKEQNEQGRS